MLPTKGALHIFFMKNRIPERKNNASKSNKLYIIDTIIKVVILFLTFVDHYMCVFCKKSILYTVKDSRDNYNVTFFF